MELLLEKLAGLSGEDLKSFKEVLSQIHHQRLYLSISLRTWMTDVQDVVLLTVLTFGQQSVDKITEVLKRENKGDLLQWPSGSSSQLKSKTTNRSTFNHKAVILKSVLILMSLFCVLSLQRNPPWMNGALL